MGTEVARDPLEDELADMFEGLLKGGLIGTKDLIDQDFHNEAQTIMTKGNSIAAHTVSKRAGEDAAEEQAPAKRLQQAPGVPATRGAAKRRVEESDSDDEMLE